eukprot:12229058-Karenia_brevis.AAC.1
MLRRTLAKYPAVAPDISEMLAFYQQRKHVGTKHSEVSMADLFAAPPPGAPQRVQWKASHAPMGPVALLLQQLHYFALALDAHTLHLHHSNFEPFPFVSCPYQLLKPTIFRFAVHARNKFAISQRSALKHATQIDEIVFHKAMARNDDVSHNRIVRYLATLGAVHKGTCQKYVDDDQDAICPFCNEEVASHAHYMWTCKHPTLAEARNDSTPELIQHMLENLHAFPTFLLYGIPQALNASFTHSWWHTESPFATHFGRLPRSVQHKYGACADTLDTSFVGWVDSLQGNSAYDVFARVAYPHRDDDINVPGYPAVFEDAPQEPNVFSDGSVTLPKQIHFAFSAAGVWWPGRSCPATHLESDYLHHDTGQKGISMWAKQPGPTTSSTRSE